jgi:hypothetical protein
MTFRARTRKAIELTMAAHSDIVSGPEPDADELPETMVTSLGVS